MKVMLDLSRLLREGKITQEEHDRLGSYAARDTGSLAINILIGLGVIAVSTGLMALLLNAMAAVVIGAIVLAAGLLFTYRGPKQWQVLATICLLVGTLMLSGAIVALGNGELPYLLAATAVTAAAGIAGHSNLLVALATVALSACLGSSTHYWHATYALSVTEPTLTVIAFSALALLAYNASRHLASYEPLAITTARVSLFLVNFGFWVGSLWGDRLPLLRFLLREDPSVVSDASDRAVVIPAMVFIIGWAIALVGIAAWAAKSNRRWVINLVAVFGAIHFYTQWFERLGANPLSVLGGGVLVLGFAIAAWKLNQKFIEEAPSAA